MSHYHIEELVQQTGYARQTIRNLAKMGLIPRPRHLEGRATRWPAATMRLLKQRKAMHDDRRTWADLALDAGLHPRGH